MKIKVELTEWQAEMISKALWYETLNEEIGKGEYATSWLKIARDFEKKVNKQ